MEYKIIDWPRWTCGALLELFVIINAGYIGYYLDPVWSFNFIFGFIIKVLSFALLGTLGTLSRQSSVRFINNEYYIVKVGENA